MSERQRPTMTETMHRIADQTEQKKLWKDHDDPEVIARMIAEETKELQDAIQESMLSGDVFSVASEIGDVLYLALKFCHSVGLVPEDVVDLKIVRNDLKYPNDLNSYGNYEEQRQKSKDMWSAMGGDEVFSHAYLDVFDKVVADEEAETPVITPFAQALASSNGNGNGHHHEDVTKLPVLVYANTGD